ncbi:hypothetical protein [Amycolatopsis saalfeldensis]|uniref:Uncharacterized protein n=1 Tax=Amycolatopsis saalfeldensis TaxID=394193 RepID=A0A1H8YQW1_9PSEU|nr:hypothetical protein [Amycolatopsis saalfeldensis]SEP54519.1 hypothetical protein SAMN04489732_1527 [Amycolatopsis saalfeldensis]
MTSTPHPEPGHRPRRRLRRRAATPAAHAGRDRLRTRSRTTTLGGIRTARPTTLWPFGDAEVLPGTALLAGWLGRTILTLVTTYTRPGDRVLLLTPPLPPRPPSRAPCRTHEGDPYAGLAEAVWTVARLGRGVDTATAAPGPDYPDGDIRSVWRAGAESGSRPRLSRLGLRPSAGPNPDSVSPRDPAGTRPDGGFDLIITALDPHATDWLACTDWGALLTPHGLAATVTHSDSHGGRLLDPYSVMVETLGSYGLRCLDHIAVLTAPAPDRVASSAVGEQTGAATLARGRSPRAGVAGPPPVRRVHHDVVLFGRLPATTPEDGATDGKETSDV